MNGKTTKQKIKPSPARVILLGVILAVAGVVFGLDIYTGGTPTWEETYFTGLVIIGFVYYLIKFIFGKRIEFDFDSFTVKGKAYSFSEISEAEVSYKRALIPGRRIRFRTVMKINIYKGRMCFKIG